MSSTGDRAARTLSAGATEHAPGAALIAQTERAARIALQGALQVAINDTDEVRGAAYGAMETFAGQCAEYSTKANLYGVPTADVDAFSAAANEFAQAATKLIRTPTNHDSYLAACATFAAVSEQLGKTQVSHDARARDMMTTAHAHTQLWTGVSVTLGLFAAAGMIAGVAGFMHAWRRDSAAHRSELDILNFASQEAANASQARTSALAQIAEQFAPALDGVANYASQLGQPEASPAERAAVAQGLAGQARAMRDTLSALREFIQSDSGNLALKRVAVPVAVTVRETVESMHPHLPDGTGLRIDVDADVPQRVMFDREKLRLAVAGLVGLGAEDARAGISQAEAWRMAPTPHTESAESADTAVPPADVSQPWIGSHLRIAFDREASQLVFTLRTPVRDMTDETLQAKLSPLSDVTRMKDASWRRWLDLAIVDRVATLSGGQAFTRIAADDACLLRVCVSVGVAENTPTLAEPVVIEFGVPMPIELREPAKVAAEPSAQSDTSGPEQAAMPSSAPVHAEASEHHEHPAASIPIAGADSSSAADCSDASDLHNDKPGRKAA